MSEFVFVMAFSFCLFFPFCSRAAEMHLTSDTMRYEPDKGMIYAEDNVRFTRGDMIISADKGDGTIDGKTVRFINNVKGEGTWSGEKVEFFCNWAEAKFGSEISYSLQGNVDCSVGNRTISAEKLIIKGEKFSAFKVVKFSDPSRGIQLSCHTINGVLSKGEIVESVAIGDVRIVLEGKDNISTFINGDKAVYSKDRGSVVVTGHAKALQDQRSIKAESLVFFPDSNRIEAIGKSTLTIEQTGEKGN